MPLTTALMPETRRTPVAPRFRLARSAHTNAVLVEVVIGSRASAMTLPQAEAALRDFATMVEHARVRADLLESAARVEESDPRLAAVCRDTAYSEPQP